jgi:hypothetical protein
MSAFDRLMTLPELFAECAKERAVMLRCRNKTMKIDADGWLILTPPDYAGSYDIEPGRIDTFAECFEWAFHLSDKTWMTPEILTDLVILLGENLERIKAEWPHA